MQFTCTQCQNIDDHKLDQSLNEVVCLKCNSIIPVSIFAKNALKGTSQVIPRRTDPKPRITANPIISEKDKITAARQAEISNKLASIAAGKVGTAPARTYSPDSGPKTKSQLAADPKIVPGKPLLHNHVTTSKPSNTESSIDRRMKRAEAVQNALSKAEEISRGEVSARVKSGRLKSETSSAQGQNKKAAAEAKLAAMQRNLDSSVDSAQITPYRSEPPAPKVDFDIEDIAASVLSDETIILDGED